jgi:ribosomal 50S subunit-recycling heat shock protein
LILIFHFSKVEKIFYESKIRINGRKLLKKSVSLKVGDEIDVLKGKSTLNPDDIVVARIEILSAVPRNESIYVTLKRFKTLQIQNYEKDPVSV